ncbi:MAG: hypothetical protein ABUU24_09665 [Variovorax sp.]
MKKLTTLFAVAALATTISLAGCKKKDDGNATSADKPAEGVKKDDKAAAPTPAPAATPDKAAAAPAAAGDLPAECNEYKASIDKLASCDKMPQQARDALKQAYDQASAGWANLPAEAKANLATACKAGTDAVTTSAKQVCGW